MVLLQRVMVVAENARTSVWWFIYCTTVRNINNMYNKIKMYTVTGRAKNTDRLYSPATRFACIREQSGALEVALFINILESI